jgi:hypothetical protein
MVQLGFGSRSYRARGSGSLAGALGIAALVALGGCATITPNSPPEAKREAVAERVNARWAALIRGDTDTAYTFLSPASKELTSLSRYKAEARSKGFRSAKIDKVDCEPESCRVTLTVVYDHPKMKGIPTLLEESWVLEDGKYWYVWRD